MGFASLLSQADALTLKVLGEGDIVYTAGGGASATVAGVFDALHVLVDAGEASIISSGPAVFLRLADLPSDPETDLGARVTRAGTVYAFKDVRKDGTGGVLLVLRRV
jgi:hypothetical protein